MTSCVFPAVALIIDPLNREGEGAVLGSLFTTVRAHSAAEGLTQLSRVTAALLIIDLALPENGGCTICRAVKQQAHPPAILVTSDDVRTIPAAIRAGCDAVLLRPFAPTLLTTRVARLFRVPGATHPGNGASSFIPTDRTWPAPCPACGTSGIVSFDAAGLGGGGSHVSAASTHGSDGMLGSIPRKGCGCDGTARVRSGQS